MPNRRPLLSALIQEAYDTQSSALVILQDGHPLVSEVMDDLGDRPIETMSVTKAVVSLLVGRAVTLGRVADVDQPVSAWFPEWKQGRKQHLTLRHLLTHTSGLQNVPVAHEELYPSPDLVQLALCAELDHPPGTQFTYNNKAVNLLIGVLARATGQPVDEFAAAELFGPLGIDDWVWQRDPAGTPHGMSGLQLRPADLARLGQLALCDGEVDGQALIHADWMRMSTSPATSVTDAVGFLWWLLPAWTRYTIAPEHVRAILAAGASAEQVAMLQGMLGTYRDRSALIARLKVSGLMPPLLPAGARWMTEEKGPQVGFRHDGWLGQHLIIHREARLVGVRLRDFNQPQTEAGGFGEFVDRFLHLAAAML
ncbi:serine hydrolase domain-containing protein [Deinococcus sonorensis]|uniref:Serine hydrolase domain-containing protein n=1 Tax=Deinococcus sonorensis TaxID=309891 RepID=A0ABV8Y824_9DEIO